MERGNLEVMESIEDQHGTTVEVLQYKKLKGSADIRTADHLYYANQAGMKLKMVRIRLNESRVRVEPGALYYMKGNLELKASTGGGILKGLMRKVTSGEKFFVSELRGTGEVYLEPTFGHFLLHRIGEKEGGVIVDKGMFYAGTAGLDIAAAIQKSISSAVFGGEGLFQTKITGAGVAILNSPVPREEIQKIPLHGDKLWVDGNFALMRSEGIRFRAEKSGKTWFSTSTSGEGLLQTFQGQGHVWVAPTRGIYEKLAEPGGLAALAAPGGASGTTTAPGVANNQ